MNNKNFMLLITILLLIFITITLGFIFLFFSLNKDLLCVFYIIFLAFLSSCAFFSFRKKIF